MKTGIELIAEERQEQIEKHGWTQQHDRQEHWDGELVEAAVGIIDLDSDRFPGWDSEEKLFVKPLKDRLIIAGALIAAEIDRLNAINE